MNDAMVTDRHSRLQSGLRRTGFAGDAIARHARQRCFSIQGLLQHRCQYVRCLRETGRPNGAGSRSRFACHLSCALRRRADLNAIVGNRGHSRDDLNGRRAQALAERVVPKSFRASPGRRALAAIRGLRPAINAGGCQCRTPVYRGKRPARPIFLAIWAAPTLSDCASRSNHRRGAMRLAIQLHIVTRDFGAGCVVISRFGRDTTFLQGRRHGQKS